MIRYYIVLKVLRPKDGVHDQLQEVARHGVAVQIYGASGPQNPVQLNQPNGHHRQVGHHIVAAQELTESIKQSAYLSAARHHLPEGSLRGHIPVPGIIKDGNLGIKA